MSGYKVKAVDTTGAGDAFLAGVLHGLLQNEIRLDDLSEEDLKSMLKFGNAMGAYVATRKGGMLHMPTLPQVEAFCNEHGSK